jgi:hypothetical protein
MSMRISIAENPPKFRQKRSRKFGPHQERMIDFPAKLLENQSTLSLSLYRQTRQTLTQMLSKLDTPVGAPEGMLSKTGSNPD